MKDLFGEEVKPSEFARTPKEIRRERARKYARKRGYIAQPGTGPKGETCKTCNHCYGNKSGTGKVFYKCGLVKPTHGPATDVLLKSPACSRWEKEVEE